MTKKERIEAFAKLGAFMRSSDLPALKQLFRKAHIENPWFTEEYTERAWQNVAQLLCAETLSIWLTNEPEQPENKLTVGVVPAGNIPLVVFHDWLSVLITGHNLLLKKSSKDSALIQFLSEKLCEIEPRFTKSLQMVSILKNIHAAIATGSDNSARYFEQYFDKYPHIIRKNRVAVAVLDGQESENELFELATDVFLYFGLGCRNVCKLLIPLGYDFKRLLDCWQPLAAQMLTHNKYANNYDYNKAILLLNREAFFDGCFCLLKPSEAWAAPTSVIFYDFYQSKEQAEKKLGANKDLIQAIVGKNYIPFGQAQAPSLTDYADGINTLAFLKSAQRSVQNTGA